MKDVIRIVLVDPIEESRASLQRLLGGIPSLWLSDVLTSYQEAANRAKDIAAHLTIVVLDHDPAQAVDLIQKLTQIAGENVLPASRGADSSLILKAIRAGAREFLTLPAESTEVLEIISKLARGRNDSKTTGEQAPRIVTVTGAVGGIGCTTLAVNLAAGPGRRQAEGNHPARPRPDLRIDRRLPRYRRQTTPCRTCFRISSAST